MKISIIGGGNIGTAIASYLALNTKSIIHIHSSKPKLWDKEILYKEKVSGEEYKISIDKVSENYEEVVINADLIFITHPSFMIEQTLKHIMDYIKPGAIIGVIPGTGGVEFYSDLVLNKNAIFFGMDRVPCVARIEKYGRVVVASKKKKTRVATIPNYKNKEVATLLSEVLNMEIEPLDNFLTVTFTPSNPLVHTSRLYSMLKDKAVDFRWKKNVPFYAEWDDESSKILIGCDNELQEICNSLRELNMSGVISLLKHYEVDNYIEMTEKIRSIETMKHIMSPMVEEKGSFIIDLNSRYFQEDIPYGLCIIKGFAEISEIETPYIDNILKWFEEYYNVEYFNDKKFSGKDLKDLPIPQNFGMNNKKEVYAFYKSK